MTDLKAYATREAAALLAEHLETLPTSPTSSVDLVSLLATAWLQGAIYAGHETLADAEIAYQKVRSEL